MSEPKGAYFLKSSEYDQKLLNQVGFASYSNPKAKDKYDLLIVGAGSAGLVAASGACSMGLSVALIEEKVMGGDCLNFGCVPSKALLHQAKLAKMRHKDDQEVFFTQAMESMRKVRTQISPADSVQRFVDMGVDVFAARASFLGKDQVQLSSGEVLCFRKALLATGAKPRTIDLDAVKAEQTHTNLTIFNLVKRPKNMLIIGGGPIGCELAQAFANFGCEVSVLDMSATIMRQEEADAAETAHLALKQQGVQFFLSAALQSAQKIGDTFKVSIEKNNEVFTQDYDIILQAIGRVQSFSDLNVDKAGVGLNDKGQLIVNDYLQTTNKNIFASGDAAGKLQFTHAAEAMSKIVLQNAFFPFWKKRYSSLMIPWCTYLSPEIAHVGLSLTQAKKQKALIFEENYREIDRSIAEDESGFARVYTNEKGFILGGTFVGPMAGEMISMVSLAMEKKIKIGAFTQAIFPYPTRVDIFKKLAYAFARRNFTQSSKDKLALYFKFLRKFI